MPTPKKSPKTPPAKKAKTSASKARPAAPKPTTPAAAPSPETARLQAAFAATRYNVEILRKSRRCGCYFCRGLFAVPRVHQWLTRKGELVEMKAMEEWNVRRPDEMPVTATCPECGADAVVGDAVGYPLTEADLVRLGEFALQQIQGDYKPIVAKEEADDEELLTEMRAAAGVESLWGPRFHDETDGVPEDEEE